MPTNVIELVTKYIPMLDYQYKVGAKSAILDAPADIVEETKSAKKVRIPKMALTGLKNYSRNKGFLYGVQTLTWEEHEFTMDRGSRFQVDVMDDVESLGVAYGRLAQEFQRMHVIPELDAYRFMTYAQLAGTKDTTAPSTTNVTKLIQDAETVLDEAEVIEEGRIMFVTPTFNNILNQSEKLQKRFDTQTKTDDMGVNFKIRLFDGMPFIVVPQTRFKSAYVFYDGETAGQENGGFVPAVDEVNAADMTKNAKDLNFMIIHPSAVMQIMKRAITRVFAPTKDLAAQTGAWGVAQNIDGWDIQDRLYHDAFVLDNKVKGIYVNHNA